MVSGESPITGVFAVRDDFGELRTIVVPTDPEVRAEVARLIARAGWRTIDITEALTVEMLRKITEGKD